jgi:CRISPR-associated protein Csx17
VLGGLRNAFAPIPVVSPWNAGSGLAGNGKNAEAERALAQVRASEDPRLSRLRASVLAADALVAEGRRRGWGGAKGELWDKARKSDVVQLCRNRLPDDALPWIDTAIVLGQDEEPTYSRLLGTGGNFGRQDLSATYVQRVLTVLADPKQAARSSSWLRAALTADESVPYLRDTVGQFDPGRAGGIQSSPFEKQDDSGFANPWSFLLALEGTVLFASAVVRRQGALMSRAALPFMVQASTAGFSGSAPEETVHGEVWTPEWTRPALLVEAEHLLGEGRADWNGRPARSGLDFARAVSSLGVDRGISHFVRHVFVERLGQNPLAVPAGRMAVTESGSMSLLADLDAWLDRLRRSPLSATVAAELRHVDDAIYGLTRDAAGTGLRAVLVALGRLHEAVTRSSTARERTSQPLILQRPDDWWAALHPETGEFRVAGALASALDPRSDGAVSPSSTLRLLLTPGEPSGACLRWSSDPPPERSAGVVPRLAAAHRRRCFPRAVPDPLSAPDQPSPAVLGVLTSFARGMTVSLADAVNFATGRLDDGLIEDYLRGLLLFDWTTADYRRLRDVTRSGVHENVSVIPPGLAILLPFFSVVPLPVRVGEEAEQPQQVVLRPGEQWIAHLRATGPGLVVRDAARRLRAAGITEVIDEAAVGRSQLDGERLAAALLLRVTPRARVRALTAVAALPAQSKPSSPVPTVTEGAS